MLTEDTTYVNVSGHAAADELTTMIETVRPRAFMPIHGEYRMLQAHARLAEQAGVPAHATRIAENGTVLELDADGLSVVGQVEAGTTLVDGMNVGSVRDVVLRDRRHLASDGVLIVVATIAADTAEPIAEPEIIARGFIEPSDDGNILLDQAREAVERVLRECQAHRTPRSTWCSRSCTTPWPSSSRTRPASGRWCCPLLSRCRDSRTTGARPHGVGSCAVLDRPADNRVTWSPSCNSRSVRFSWFSPSVCSPSRGSLSAGPWACCSAASLDLRRGQLAPW